MMDFLYGVYHETVALLIGGYAVAFVGLWKTSTHFKAAGVSILTGSDSASSPYCSLSSGDAL